MAYLSYRENKRLVAFLCLQFISLSSGPAFAAADASMPDTPIPPQAAPDAGDNSSTSNSGSSGAAAASSKSDAPKSSSGANTPEASPAASGSSGAADAPKAQASPNPLDEISPELAKRLQDLESHFFGHIYTTEPVEHRMTRLERFVFGTETGGPYPIRIDRLASTLLVSDPDGTKREIKLKPPREELKPQTANSNGDSGGGNSSGGSANSNANNGSNIDSPPANTQAAASPAAPVMPVAGGSQPDEPVIQKTDLDEPPTYRRTVAISAPVSLSKQPKVLVMQVTKSTFTTVGKPNDIIRELDQAIRVHPSDPELFFERAKAYIQMDKLSNALNDLSDAIRDQPNKSDYYIARAWCYKKLGNSYLAADDIKQARFVDPGLPPQIDLLQNNKAIAPAQTE